VLSQSSVQPGHGADHPAIVAVVLNWNGFDDTKECLESLLCSDLAPAHIVVIDNGSIDGSPQRLKEWAAEQAIDYTAFFSPAAALVSASPTTRFIFIETGKNLGYAGANNVGMNYAIDRAGAEFVWVLNNDLTVDPRALERALRIAQGDPKIGMVGAQILSYDDPETIQAMGGGYIRPILCHDTQLHAGQKAQTSLDEPIDLHHLIGASLLVRAEAALDVGPIDESYFLYREETDWCLRMSRKGWRLCCSPSSIVWHKQARSVGFKSPMHDYYAVRNILRLVKKFYPASLPTAFAYHASRALLPKLARFQMDRVAAVLHALRDFMAGVDGRPDRYSEAAFVRAYVPHPEQFPVAPELGNNPGFVERRARARS
jgi:GT2 family glycosyltransferase